MPLFLGEQRVSVDEHRHSGILSPGWMAAVSLRC